MKSATSLREHILDRVSIEQTTGCWVWMRKINRGGYGELTINGRRGTRAMRVSYEAFVGPIPPGLALDHRCRHRWCVNPDHLEPVTLGENTMRGDTMPARNIKKEMCPRGHRLVPRPANHRWRFCPVCKSSMRREQRARALADRLGGAMPQAVSQ